jgi:Putative MetA-pathway of phenol degradation
MVGALRQDPMRHSLSPNFLIVAGGIALLFSAIAQNSFGEQPDSAAPSPDKSQYNLFNPTPCGQLRDFAPDRPDQTEGPFTVDAGHLQLELGVFQYTYTNQPQRFSDIRTDSYQWFNAAIKLGVLNNLDLELFVPIYNEVDVKQAGVKTRMSGFGDLVVRAKLNLFGNEGNLPIAMGFIPFLKIPTNEDGLGNRAVEGGFILPGSFKLPWDFQLAAMTELDINEDSANTGYHLDYVNSVSLHHPITKKLDSYIEFFTDISTERHTGWVGTVDGGLAYSVSDNVILDTGVNAGVTKAAQAWQPFIGLSFRF